MKSNSNSSSTERIDGNRRKVVRDGLALAGLTFTGLLSACGAPESGDSESSSNDVVLSGPSNDDEIPVTGGTPDVKFEAVRFTLRSAAAPATQTVNLPAGFGVPKGIIMIQTADRFGGTGYNNGSLQIGFSDGVNSICIHGQHDSEVTPGQKCFRGMWNNQVSVRTQGTTNDGVRNRISVSSFATDRVVLSIDEMDFPGSEEFECFIIAIGGSDVDSVIVGNSNLGTGTSEIPVNIGHESDLVFTISDHDSTFNFKGQNNRSADNGCNVSYGVAINDGRNSQACVAWSSPHAPSSNPAANTTAIYNDSVIASTADGATENFSVAVTGFNGSGIEVWPSASAGNCIFGYLSIKFRQTVNMAIVDTTIPASGDVSVTGAGFRPGFGMWLNLNGPAAYNLPADASFSLATTVFGGSNIYSHMNNGLDGVPNTDLGAWGRAGTGFQMMDTGGTFAALDVQASGYAFTNDGVDFAMTNNPSNPILGRMLLLGVN